MKRIVLLIIVAGFGTAEGPRPALFAQTIFDRERSRISIENTGGLRVMTPKTNIDGGYAEGDMLNFHFFPGLVDYGQGMYAYAEQQMSFVIRRPDALDRNPRKAEFMSTAHYIRGMVYAHHATGIGARNLAKTDFESAISYNPKNFVAYLELARLYVNLGFNDEAATVLNRLLELKPDETTAQEAQKLLSGMGSGASR